MQFPCFSHCFNELHWRYFSNSLQHNPDKSEAILIGAQARLRHESAIHEVKLDNALVELAHSTKNLGVTIDNALTLTEHGNSVCEAAHYHVRALRHVRKCVSEDITKSIATSLVGAHVPPYFMEHHATTSTNFSMFRTYWHV